jgi:hypothetical protein
MRSRDTQQSAQAIATHWLVCHAQGWAWGDLSQAQAQIERSWPEGEPPLDGPLEEFARELGSALSRVAQDARCAGILVADLPAESAPDWWPTKRRRIKPWQAMFNRSGWVLGAVRHAPFNDLDASTWAWAKLAKGRDVPGAVSARRIGGPWHSHWLQFLLSALGVLALHLVLTLWVQPMLMSLRQESQQQAEQERAQAQQQRALAQAKALQAERARQREQWQQGQAQALRPLEALWQITRALDTVPARQLWTELRYAQGAWVMQGVSGSAVVLHDKVALAWQNWHPELLEVEPGVWPPEPDLGWPAWRFRVRLPFETPTADTQGKP